MHEEVTRQAPETVAADPVKVAPKRAVAGAAAPPAGPPSGFAAPVARGVQLAPTSRIQRRSTGVIQREGGDDEPDDVADEAPSLAVADVLGEDNGPAAMKTKYDDAEKAARTATGKIGVLPLTNPTQITLAKKEVTKAQALVEATEEVVEEIEQKREAIETLQDDDALSDDDIGLLQDAGTEYQGFYSTVKSSVHKLNEFYAEESGKVGLAADAAGASQAQIQKMNGLRGKWGSAALAKGHYDKHKSDTGATDEEDYLTRAQVHNNLTPSATVLQKVKGKDTLTFNTATGDFGVKSNEGAKQIRTFFRPNGGRRYFDRQ